MGGGRKRKADLEHEQRRLEKRMKKLKQRLGKSRREKHYSASSSSDEWDNDSSSSYSDSDSRDASPLGFPRSQLDDIDPPLAPLQQSSEPTTTAQTPTVAETGNISMPLQDNASTPIAPIADSANPTCGGHALDEKFLEAIGKRIVAEKLFGPAMNEPTLIRWKDVLEKGLPSEEKDELAKKHLCPSNCACIEAPKINLELKNFLQAPVIDRDNRLILKQDKIALCIAALSSLITPLCQNEVINNIQMVNILSEACRLLLDLQRDESLTRRSLILMTLKQPLKDILNLTIIDEFLFSKELEEKIKAAQLLEKSNKELLLFNKSSLPKNSKGPLRRSSNNKPSKPKLQSGHHPKSSSTNSYHSKPQNNKREDRHPLRSSRQRYHSREKKS